jgi:HPt (histidine-containing phosphotransfer) domain-containing protein
MSIPNAEDWVRGLVPDLDRRMDAFQVDCAEVDDELIEAFKEELATQSALLRQGLDSGDLETVQRAAHSVKGMGGTIGLPEISVLAHEVELRAKSGDQAGCAKLVEAFIDWTKIHCGS